jgi:dTDP-4-dehydrorhamnose 3,5-epimerase
MNVKIDGVEVDELQRHEDNRGWLLELWRSDELLAKMGYVSITLPGIGRGPHEHVKQTDVFVFPGFGEFMVRLWDARENSPTNGMSMDIFAEQGVATRVIVPPGVIHGYKNVSDVEGMVFNFPDKLFAGVGKKEPVDEIRHESIEGSPYEL